MSNGKATSHRIERGTNDNTDCRLPFGQNTATLTEAEWECARRGIRELQNFANSYPLRQSLSFMVNTQIRRIQHDQRCTAEVDTFMAEELGPTQNITEREGQSGWWEESRVISGDTE